MSFADDLKLIDSKRINKERDMGKKESLVVAKFWERARLLENVKKIFVYSKENGFISGSKITGFWGYLPYRFGDGDETLCFVPCAVNDINVGKMFPKDEATPFYSICTYNTIGLSQSYSQPMSMILRELDVNDKYSGSEFLELLSGVLTDLGFRNISCSQLQGSYYVREYGFISEHWVKKTVNIGFMSCAF